MSFCGLLRCQSFTGSEAQDPDPDPGAVCLAHAAGGERCPVEAHAGVSPIRERLVT